MSALEVRAASKSFGPTVVLDRVTFAVEHGSITAILGPSGGGKTTILRLVAGFEPVDAGEILLDGTPVSAPATHVAPERRRVGFVPQEGALFPHLSVVGNVGFGLPRAKSSAARVEECLELVGMAGFGSRRPHELSGGQQQRVALARALAPRPRLVLMDEPFSALDAAMRPEVCADVVAALRGDGATAVIVTHDRDEALAVADQLVLVMDGRIEQAGDPVTLHRSPASGAVKAFLGDVDIVEGTVDGGVVVTAVGTFPLGRGQHAGAKVDVLVRQGTAAVFARH